MISLRIIETKIEPQRVYQKERFMVKVKVDKNEKSKLPVKLPISFGGGKFGKVKRGL